MKIAGSRESKSATRFPKQKTKDLRPITFCVNLLKLRDQFTERKRQNIISVIVIHESRRNNHDNWIKI